jgi:para-nitrobenzyl esterase
LASLVLACLLAPASAAQHTVRTDKGHVSGIETATVKQYLGIPYASPPVGDLRWRPPQPAARWQGVLRATQFANHCPQTESPFGSASTTEDCLYLNVYAPKRQPRGDEDTDDDEDDDERAESRGKAKQRGDRERKRRWRGKRKHRDDDERHESKRRPVMVWIHGGGLTAGESNDYDPVRLVDKGVVVVTFNYRLGYLGFLAHPALTAESTYQGSGNYGLMDQQAALRWVERNIGRFGGDSDDVTIFGQSAGGLSVHSQLASPLADDLFDSAIAMSGAYDLDQRSLAQAESEGSTAAAAVGCTDQTLTCLRNVPVNRLLANQPALPGAIGPTIDGHVLHTSVREAFSSGRFNRVPVIEGSTHDEFTIFIYLAVETMLGPVSPTFYPIVLGILLPSIGSSATVADVMNEYPLTDYPTAGEALSAVGTDAVFACPGREAARVLSQHVPTHAYEFNDPNAPQPFVPPASFPYKAFHAGELAYLFDSTTFGGHAPFTPDQEALAAAMVGYWTNFAHRGNPNGRGVPAWAGYTRAGDTYQSLEPPTPKPITGFATDHHCDFWASR